MLAPKRQHVNEICASIYLNFIRAVCAFGFTYTHTRYVRGCVCLSSRTHGIRDDDVTDPLSQMKIGNEKSTTGKK